MKDYAKDRIDLLEEFIRNSTEKITQDVVNANSYYSYRHANRLFRSIKGDSINSYSTKIRIQTSAEYLAYSSKSIADIAIEVGYESTAAYSKAFKKLYKQTPTEFRQAQQFDSILENPEMPYYTFTYFDSFEVYIQKVIIKADISDEAFYTNVKNTFETTNIDFEECMLLWDEDPELCQVSESRYFLRVDPNNKQENEYDKIILKGRYAVFDTQYLHKFAYEFWAKIIYLLLSLDKRDVRHTGHFIEWYTQKSLDNPDTFLPYKIAVPLQ